ncbi:MAG: DUF2231 domain-containing protein [Thermoleophilia bacterium]|nr:DUF2231 domain-containing protein [Thermoleophilia bacterium]
MKPTELVTGLPGHPTHPPLTDVTIGLYTGAAAFAVLSALGVAEQNLAVAWWLALLAALVATVPTAVTGLLDWLKITRGTPLWRTATAHLLAMVTATVVFLVAAIVGHGGYVDREVTTGALLLTLAGFALLTLGGWLGGTVVFVHGMRVLGEKDRPTADAVRPDATNNSAGGAPQQGLTRAGEGRHG